MDSHHMMSEEDQRQVCPCCGRPTEPKRWKSMFDAGNLHYKACVCSCGYRMTIKVPFIGTGHDRWNRRFDNLDRKIEEEEEE